MNAKRGADWFQSHRVSFNPEALYWLHLDPPIHLPWV